MSEIPTEPPVAGDEVSTLIGSLERQRATFAWKAGGLDAAGLNARVGASSLTLGGLLKHVAMVEEVYFSVRMLGRPPCPPWDTWDWEGDPDWPYTSAAEDTPEELMRLWQSTVERSRAALAQVLEEGGLDQRARWKDLDDPPSVRRVLIDLIEEYARHTGHADLLREAVDGLVGEDPPR